MNRLEDLYRKRAWLAAEIEREEAAQARRGRATVSSGAVIGSTADLYGVTVEQVLSTSRDPRIVKARQGAMWLLRADGWSLPKIGAALGRDHTTVLHACNKIDGDPATRGLLWPLLRRGEAVA